MAKRYYFITLADGNVCVDCLQREAFQPVEGRTLQEIIKVGLPGAGNTICKSRDRCQVVEKDYVDLSDDLEFKKTKFVFIRSGELSQTPKEVSAFYDLMTKALLAGFDKAELEVILLPAKTLNEMIEGIQGIL